MGCARALGVTFLDEKGNAFAPTPVTLHKIASFDLSGAEKLLFSCTITAMCDIDNPMHGKKGAFGTYDLGVSAIFSINTAAVDFEIARWHSWENLGVTMDNIARILRL